MRRASSYFLTLAQGGRWGLIDVGAVYKRAGLGGDRWTRSSVAVSLRDRGRGRAAGETLLLLLRVQEEESLLAV
jgi:hypothetical protein